MNTEQNQTVNGREYARREALASAEWVAEHLNDPNWWACYGLWVFTLFAHKDLRILNGARDKWTAGGGRPISKDKAKDPETAYWLISLAALIVLLVGILCLLESVTPRTAGTDQWDFAAGGAPSRVEVTIGEAIQALSVRHL